MPCSQVSLHTNTLCQMNNLRSNSLNWESQQVLSQIADRIDKPLSEIVRLLQYIKTKHIKTDSETERITGIMLESSEQIEKLIQDILLIEKNKRVEVRIHDKFKYPDIYKRSHGRTPNLDLDWLIDLENTVLGHLDYSGLSVSWLASQMAVSERDIFRRIEKYTGLTPNNYIRNIRMFKAKELLENYALSTVNEVACAVGLRDPHYFSSLYKSQFGVKPKDYLK
jgi:AraC-like DNA-binding protein